MNNRGPAGRSHAVIFYALRREGHGAGITLRRSRAGGTAVTLRVTGRMQKGRREGSDADSASASILHAAHTSGADVNTAGRGCAASGKRVHVQGEPRAQGVEHLGPMKGVSQCI